MLVWGIMQVKNVALSKGANASISGMAGTRENQCEKFF